MADIKVSAMTAAGSVSDSDTVYVVQSGVSRRATRAQVIAGLATAAALADHVNSTANPHGVTAAQLGCYTAAQTDTLLGYKADVVSTALLDVPCTVATDWTFNAAPMFAAGVQFAPADVSDPPANLDTAYPPSSQARGRVLAAGHAGEADTWWTCLRAADASYAWAQVLTTADAGAAYLAPDGSGAALTGVVHTSGDESIAGVKTFTDDVEIAGVARFGDAGPTVDFGTAAPTTGAWVTGSVRWNSAVASGQPEGWRCTAGGTPGTWTAIHFDDTSFSAPATLYAVEGREMCLYFDSIVRTTTPGLRYVASSSVGNPYSDRWSLVPRQGLIGTVPLTVTAANGGDTVATVSPTISISYLGGLFPVARKLLAIGDSTLSGGYTLAELLNLCNYNCTSPTAGGGASHYTLTTVGTHSSVAIPDGGGTNRTVNHEAISGWTVDLFYSDASSPFVFSGAFNFETYLSTNSISLAASDWVLINIGVNDLFSASSDAAVEAIITDRFAKIETMITSIQSAVSGVRVGILSMIPPPQSQDDFALVYLSQNRDRYRRNRDLWVDAAYDQFSGRAGSGVHLIPYGEHLDPAHGFPATTVPVNAYTSGTTQTVADNGVHPAPNGYYQLGAAIYAYLLNTETWTPVATVCNGTTGNGDLEVAGTAGEPFANWYKGVTGASAVTRDTAVYHAGASSSKFVVEAVGGTSCYLTHATPLVSGKTYAYAFWGKAQTGTPQLYVGAGAGTVTHTLSTSWQRFSGTFVAGSTTFLIARVDTGVTFWVDDVRLVQTD